MGQMENKVFFFSFTMLNNVNDKTVFRIKKEEKHILLLKDDDNFFIVFCICIVQTVSMEVRACGALI